jgi:hypothetical protein
VIVRILTISPCGMANIFLRICYSLIFKLLGIFVRIYNIKGVFSIKYWIKEVQFSGRCCVPRDFSCFTGNSKNHEKFRLGAEFVPVHAQKLANFSDVFKCLCKIRFHSSKILDRFCLCYRDVLFDCYVICLVCMLAAMIVISMGSIFPIVLSI